MRGTAIQLVLLEPTGRYHAFIPIGPVRAAVTGVHLTIGENIYGLHDRDVLHMNPPNNITWVTEQRPEIGGESLAQA
jgi:hypothetical protein